MAISTEQVQSIMIDANPYAAAAGIIVELAEPGHVRLSMAHEPCVQNPFGAIHAGALYTFGETSAASLVISSVELEGRMVLMKAGQIDYGKIVKEQIFIDATMTADEIQAVNDAVSENGKHNFPVRVVMAIGDGTEMCSATYTAHVRKV